ncbi:SH3 domain-containing protein [Crocinitomicaceae bacterium]|nr:SH3 domain-containing protein [Crocinitomicaceae bacterium]
MKNVILFAFALVANLSFSQYEYEDMRLLSSEYEFEEGSTETLYGDNVVLRKKPSTESKAIDTLSIGSEVKILENSRKEIVVNGKTSYWYKVKSNKGTGYVAGGFIALDSREINGGKYMVIVAEANEESKFRVRYLKNGEFYGKEGALYTYSFVLRVHDGRGVEGVESMLLLDFMAESCGADGGYTYLFNNGNRLINAIHCAEVGDGGFWFSEKLTFPDERGWGTHIGYEREVGQPMDGDHDWYQSKKDALTLEWKEDHFEPNVSEFDFGEEDW